MNLIENSFEKNKIDSSKKIARIILIIIAILIIITIALVCTLVYIQQNTMRLTLNGQSNDKLLELLVFEDNGDIYVPIKEVASYFGYSSYNGDYSNKSEDISKCYVQSDNEVATFSLNSNKIYKLNTNKGTDYDYFYMDKPVKAMNGVLYMTVDGMEKAFNLNFSYNQESKRITINTMTYLNSVYRTRILDYGYTELSNDFTNQKAILDSMLVVSKNSQYGVINANNGEIIIEPKYDSITYLQHTGDFLVGSDGKVGIISKDRQTKVQLIYDSITLMDIDSNLYLVKQDNKFGIIDVRGNTKLYSEYDEIGSDNTKFSRNVIKSKYLLLDNLIPVRKGNKWGLFDKYGNQVVDFEYDSFGYIASNNKDALNLLVIPDYDVIVACQDKRYRLLNSSGQRVFEGLVDGIYMTISSGETHYYMSYSNEVIDAEEWLDSHGVKAKTNTTTNNNTSTNNNTNTTNTTNTNSTNITNNTNNTNQTQTGNELQQNNIGTENSNEDPNTENNTEQQ